MDSPQYYKGIHINHIRTLVSHAKTSPYIKNSLQLHVLKFELIMDRFHQCEQRFGEKSLENRGQEIAPHSNSRHDERRQ